MNVVFDYIDATNKGVLETIRLIGAKPILWNRGQKSAFDLFDEVKPVLAILNPEWIDRGTYKSLLNHGTKLAFASDGTKSEQALKLMIEGKVGYRVEEQPYANLFSFFNRSMVTHPIFECEYLIMSDWLSADQVQLAVRSFEYTDDVKVLGNQYVPHPWYIGFVPPNEETVAITSSSKVVLPDNNLNEYNVYLSGAKAYSLDTKETTVKPLADIWKEKRTSIHLIHDILEGVGFEDKVSDTKAVIERYENEFGNLIG